MQITKTKILVGSDAEKLRLMADLAYRYREDVRGFDLDSLHQKLCENYSTERGEIFQRPKITLKSKGDCDDQAIAVVAYASINHLPWLLEVLKPSGSPDSNQAHVTVWLRTPDGKWKNVDGLPYAWPDKLVIIARLSKYQYEQELEDKTGYQIETD